MQRSFLHRDQTSLNIPRALGVGNCQEKTNERKNVRGMDDFVALGIENLLRLSWNT